MDNDFEKTHAPKRKKATYFAEIKETLRLGLPIVVGQLSIMAMGVADTIQVGMIPVKGTASVSAAGVSNGIFITIAVIGMITLGVIAPMISKAKAENDLPQCNRLFRSALWLGFGLGIITAILIAMGVYLLDYLEQSPEVTALAKPFGYVIALSVIPQFIFLALRQLSDGIGKTQFAMFMTVSALFMNIGLNWLLIYGHWGFPQLELIGSGTATFISRMYMMLGMALFIFRNTTFKPYLHQAKGSLKELITKILTIGISSGFQGFFEIGVFTAAVIIIGWLGKDPQTAHVIAINMCSVTYMMMTGVASAGGIRVGRAWGLQDKPHIWLSGTVALLIAGAFMAACSLLFFTANHWLVSLYTDDKTVIAIAVELVIIGGLFQLSDGIQATALGILRGIADVKIPTLITLFAYWVVGLPLGYWLGFSQAMGANGVWLGLTAGLTVSAVLLVIRFYGSVRKFQF